MILYHNSVNDVSVQFNVVDVKTICCSDGFYVLLDSLDLFFVDVFNVSSVCYSFVQFGELFVIVFILLGKIIL